MERIFSGSQLAPAQMKFICYQHELGKLLANIWLNAPVVIRAVHYVNFHVQKYVQCEKYVLKKQVEPVSFFFFFQAKTVNA